MTDELKKQAIDAAHRVREEFFSDNCGVLAAFMRIFKRYNIKVFVEDCGEEPRKEGDKYILTLPFDTKTQRDYYTLAHEIGHIVLGHSIEAMQRLSYCQYDEFEDEDRQANIFAAELLMPKDDFFDVCKKYMNNKYKVARYFSVLPETAGVRMMILGITK